MPIYPATLKIVLFITYSSVKTFCNNYLKIENCKSVNKSFIFKIAIDYLVKMSDFPYCNACIH